ncbi:MAG: hypothetical protein JST23_05895 [Bacteroidetes bacterium]|nr:hypothetical protein [Bacteroidota bacterium]
MKLLKINVFAIGMIASTAIMAQSKITVTKGQKFDVISTNQSTTSAEVMGQSMETNINSNTTAAYAVTDVNDKEISLTSTVTKMVMSVKGMGGEQSYNSEDKKSSGQLADVLNKTLNKPKNITIDQKGNITKQDKEDEEMASMGAMSASSSTNYTDLFLPGLIGATFTAGTEVPYNASSKSENGSALDSGVYKITSIENGIASISYKGTQTTTKTIEQMGMEMQVTGTNAVKSELQVDVATGLVLLKATVVDINMSVDAGGMMIPVTGKSVTTTTVKPVQ